MSKILLASVVAVAGTLSSAAMGQIIYDNQSSLPGTGALGIVTDPGLGSGGADASALTTPSTTFGFGSSSAAGIRLADDFTIPVGQTWTITGANLFGYTTNATAPTNTGATVRILSADPLGSLVGGVSVAGGDTTTNVQVSNAFYGPQPIFRVTSTTLTNTARRVQQVTTSFVAPIVLGPGTYWIDFDTTGITFVPPITTAGAPTGPTGNARQVITTGAYAATIDAGSTFAGGVPFQLIGSVPAPGSVALLGLGGLFAARRRR